MTALLIILVVVAVVVGLVAYGAMVNKRSFRKQGQIIQGVDSRAPAAWAGDHSPEAKLHRRLRAAVDGARAQLGTGAGFDDVVASIGRGAQEIDDRLIAAAALPAQFRDKAIADVEPSVVALEAAVAGIGATAGQTDQGAITAAIAEANQRLAALNEARAEVARVDRNEVDLDQAGLNLPPPAARPQPRPDTG
jgi:hypothetical protein